MFGANQKFVKHYQPTYRVLWIDSVLESSGKTWEQMWEQINIQETC